MFGFKQKKAERVELIAVVDGNLIPIEGVKDPVFSEKMMGDGFAIEAIGEEVYSCGDAIVTMLFPSHHAVGLKLDDGMEILIHIGIDTVNENGKGFTSLIAQGDRVKKGQALIQFDRTYLIEKGYDVTTIVIFTNKDTYKEFKRESAVSVKGGKDIVASYTI